MISFIIIIVIIINYYLCCFCVWACVANYNAGGKGEKKKESVAPDLNVTLVT